METKKCKVCGEVKTIDLFAVSYVKGKEYLRGECRKCHSAKVYKCRRVKTAHMSESERIAYNKDRYHKERISVTIRKALDKLTASDFDHVLNAAKIEAKELSKLKCGIQDIDDLNEWTSQRILQSVAKLNDLVQVLVENEMI